MLQTRAATQISARTRYQARPSNRFGEDRAQHKTRTRVPIISLIKFAAKLRMAGMVQKQSNLKSLFSVSFQCGKKCSRTRTAPRKATAICDTMYGASFA